jgi:hypothetical protein
MTTRRWSRIPLLIGLSLALAFLLAPLEKVEACMGDCSLCSGCSSCYTEGGSVYCSGCNQNNSTVLATPDTIVSFVNPRHVRITVEGYKTTNLQPTTSCVTALSPIEGVERVNSIRNFNSDVNRPFQEVAFFPAETPGRELASIASAEGLPLGTGGNWFGFVSKITGTVNNNVSNHFVVDLTLKKGVQPEDFIRALRSQGVFVTSSSTPDGIPNAGHQYFRRLDATDLVVLYPERPEKPERSRQ